ncbi:hypothetical protein SMICM304S_07692 [Streptomyces microflavus]
MPSTGSRTWPTPAGRRSARSGRTRTAGRRRRPERRGRRRVAAAHPGPAAPHPRTRPDRGYTLASIKEPPEAWDAGRGLGGVLGLAAEAHGPGPTRRRPDHPRGARRRPRFGRRGIAEAVELGVLEARPRPGRRVPRTEPPGAGGGRRVRHAAAFPLLAISGHPTRSSAARSSTTSRFLQPPPPSTSSPAISVTTPTDSDAAEAASSSPARRPLPLAEQTVDAELARAMRTFATRHLHHHLGLRAAPSRAARPVRRCCRPGQRRPCRIWFGRSRWRPSSRRPPNASCRQGPWIPSPHLAQEPTNLTKWVKSHATCPQNRQIAVWITRVSCGSNIGSEKTEKDP